MLQLLKAAGSMAAGEKASKAHQELRSTLAVAVARMSIVDPEVAGCQLDSARIEARLDCPAA